MNPTTLSNQIWERPSQGRFPRGAKGAVATAAVITLLVHAAMAAVLFWTESERQNRKPMRPLEVTLITPRLLEPPKLPPPPRQKRVVKPVEIPKPDPAPPPPIEAPQPVEEAVVDGFPSLPVEEPPPVEPTPVVIEPPRFDVAYLNNPKPAYPATAKRLKLEGQVLLSVFVDTNGAAGQVKIAKSSGVPLLDDAAIEAVRRWTFVPGRQGDELMADWVEVPISFRLKSNEQRG